MLGACGSAQRDGRNVWSGVAPALVRAVAAVRDGDGFVEPVESLQIGAGRSRRRLITGELVPRSQHPGARGVTAPTLER